jgi:hypothetical protein
VWRKRVLKSHRRTLDAASVAFFIATTFIVAGTHAISLITYKALTIDQVSSRLAYPVGRTRFSLPATPPAVVKKLAGLSLLNSNDSTVQQYIAPLLNQKSGEHLQYAQRCYQEDDDSRLPDDCGILSTPTLPYTTTRNAPCPLRMAHANRPMPTSSSRPIGWMDTSILASIRVHV